MSQSQNFYQQPNQPPASKGIGDYFSIIREKLYIATFIGLILGGGYAAWKFQENPRYRSTATVRFDIESEAIVPFQAPANTSTGRMIDIAIQNHMIDMGRPDFMARYMDSFDDEELQPVVSPIIAAMDEGEKEDLDEDALEQRALSQAISDGISLERTAEHIIQVSFTHEDPLAAQTLTNRHVIEYEQFLISRYRGENDDAIRKLRAQAEEKRLQVENGDLAVMQYREEYDLLSLEEDRNIIQQQYETVSSALISARQGIVNLETQVALLDEALDAGRPTYELPFIRSFGSIESRVQELSRLRSARETLSLRYGPRHPEMIRNSSMTESITRELREETERALNDLRQRYNDQRKMIASLQREQKAVEEELHNLDRTSIEYNVLRRNLVSNQQLYQQILQRLNEAVIASRLTDSGMEIVNYAGVSQEPYTPNEKKIVMIAVFLCFASIIGIPIGLDFLSSKIKSRLDVETHLGKELLGEIHKIKRRKKMDLNKVVLNQSPMVASELFRIFYSSVILNLPRGFPKTLIVSSPLPQEGKSFIASNLAASLSRHHHRTLLIDCDLRRPSLHHSFGADNEKGLIDWFRNGPEASASTHQQMGIVQIAEDFDFMPAGGRTGEATEIIRSERFSRMLDYMRTIYDVILIDTPPAAVFPDALSLSEYSQHTLLVCRPKRHNRNHLKVLIRQLDQSPSKVLGLVFNRGRLSKNQLGKGAISYYSNYQLDVTAHRSDKKSSEKEKTAVAAGESGSPANESAPKIEENPRDA